MTYTITRLAMGSALVTCDGLSYTVYPTRLARGGYLCSCPRKTECDHVALMVAS
jgi:hypothetical protein